MSNRRWGGGERGGMKELGNNVSLPSVSRLQEPRKEIKRNCWHTIHSCNTYKNPRSMAVPLLVFYAADCFWCPKRNLRWPK